MEVFTAEMKQLINESKKRSNSYWLKGLPLNTADRELLDLVSKIDSVVNPPILCEHPTSFEDRCCSCGEWVN